MTTWGEGGLSFPTEDAASTPTAPNPSAVACISEGAGERCAAGGRQAAQHSDLKPPSMANLQRGHLTPS